ncbi:RHS repeat-associated core domain-containing protein [Flavobacterium sp.]|uniref:RHS repeat-associated core domain-containing protein n=1 Tax=Flavobacterium sp. TaxID=239 RepID=UPI0040332FD5
MREGYKRKARKAIKLKIRICPRITDVVKNNTISPSGLSGSSRLGLWERNKKLTFTPVTETIQSVYRGDKRYKLSDHLGNVHVVLTDRKELHCGLEDNVPFPEYYTAEVKNRYDYYPFGMLMEERKYGASVCRYDIDTSFIATVMDQNFEEDPTLDAWLYVISSATPNYGSGSMLLDYDQDPLITYWPADEGDRYKVTFSFSFEGDCDSLQVLGNVQNSTTQSYTSGGTYTFDFTVNDVSGGYGVFGFYKDNPDCIVYIHSVKIEQYTTSTQVVCDTDSVAGYRYGFNGQEKIDEQYGIEGTAYLFEYRVYDSRIGRFLSVDPLFKEYSWNSVYAFAENDVIRAVDIEGLEKAIVIQFSYRGVYYRSTVIRVPNGSKKNVSNPDGILYQRLDITNFNRAEIENEIRTFKQLAKIPSGVTDVGLNDPKYDRDIQEGFSNRAEEVAYEGVVNANADSRNIFPLGVINVEFPTDKGELPEFERALSEDVKSRIAVSIIAASDPTWSGSLSIDGYASDRPTNYPGGNLQLSKDRADAAMQYVNTVAERLGLGNMIRVNPAEGHGVVTDSTKIPGTSHSDNKNQRVDIKLK